MLWCCLAALASAGTIYLDATTPVLVKLDGELVRKEPATRVIAPDLEEGPYKVEITNLTGKTIAFKEVTVAWREDVYLEYADGYLDVVTPPAELMYSDKGLPIIPENIYTKMMRKLVKGSVKKKLKVLDGYTEGYGLTMAQVDDLLNAFHLRQDRLAALVMISDRVTEPDKYPALNHHFAVPSDQERMVELFEAILAKSN